MADNIKLNPVNSNKYQQFNQTNLTKKVPESTEKASISNITIEILKLLLNSTKPPHDPQKINEIMELINSGQYTVDHEQLAEHLLAEFFPK